MFPELAAYRRTATRLHPRLGSPGVHDSSVGGPLLWPADEPWPTCPTCDYGVLRTEGVRLRRRVLEKAWRRTRWRTQLELTDQEKADLEAADAGPTEDEKAPPYPLMALAQLYARDVPGLAGPEGTDLLQVLWCPLEHAHENDLEAPDVHLRWRRAADVGTVLADQPEPLTVDFFGDHLPEPCVLHPEAVTEYQYVELLPEALQQRIRDWEKATDEDYHDELSVADGWKLGGFARFNLTGPEPMVCSCGRDMELLLTIATTEWESPYGGSWRPLEEPDYPGEFHVHALPNMPTQITISRGYNLWVFTCPASFAHPLKLTMQ